MAPFDTSKLGRVRVTFILDTALVVLIGELMGLWFREYAPEKVLLGLGATAAVARKFQWQCLLMAGVSDVPDVAG